MNNLTIAAITFSASGLMHLSMASGEKISLHEYEGERFKNFVYGEHRETPTNGAVPKTELLAKVRKPNRNKNVSQSFSPLNYEYSNKDFRRKKNAMARRNDNKSRNRSIGRG